MTGCTGPSHAEVSFSLRRWLKRSQMPKLRGPTLIDEAIPLPGDLESEEGPPKRNRRKPRTRARRVSESDEPPPLWSGDEAELEEPATSESEEEEVGPPKRARRFCIGSDSELSYSCLIVFCLHSQQVYRMGALLWGSFHIFSCQ